MNRPQQATAETESRSVGAGGWGDVGVTAHGSRVSHDEEALELDHGDGCTTL